jgi:transposase/CYTH domain-containing protein
MGKYIHQTKTKNGSIKVRIIFKDGRKFIKTQHIGVAHNDLELALFLEKARQEMVDKHQPEFEFVKNENASVTIKRGYKRFLFNALGKIYDQLNFDKLRDNIFKDLVIARIIEPTSKLDSVRVLQDLGIEISNSSIHRSLRRAAELNYRKQISKKCVEYAQIESGSSVLYDVTTLYFEIDKEDDYRKSGFSKERRLEPQIIVGLLVNKHGFPLAINSFEGNKAETKTLVPVLQEFKTENGIKEITVVADAGMMSEKNLEILEQEKFKFIVGSRLSKVPYEIDQYCKNKKLFDGHIFETIDENGRRIIYQYSAKRGHKDLKNIEKQKVRAQKQIDSKIINKQIRFLQVIKTGMKLNEKNIEKATKLAGIKGYVTNFDAEAQTIINAYHSLFAVERSFRMTKSDLKARPIFHQIRDSIEAHLTICFAALAIARHIQDKTGLSIRKFLEKLKPLLTAVIKIGTKEITFEPYIDENVRKLLDLL